MASSTDFDINDIIENQDKFSSITEGEGVVLFLGETGNGKTTLTLFIAGNQKLSSVGELGHFTIQDLMGKISSREETSQSQTVYPELLTYEDSDDKHVLMDTPGFEDTRSTQMEVMCALHMKNALRSSPMVKIVLVISYDDIKPGGRRDSFAGLITHAATFLRKFEVFEDSIGLIVTKIPPTKEKVGEAYILISDDKWKQHIEEALKNLRNSIQSQANIPQEKQTTYKYVSKVIDMLLRGENAKNDSSLIGIFRSPEAEGPIYDMDPFPDCRESLRKLVSNLQYASIQTEDFGYTISDSARQCITNEVPHIVETITKDLDVVLRVIERSYNEFEKCEEDLSEVLKEFKKQDHLWKSKYQDIQQMERTSEILDFLLKMLENQAKESIVSKYSATDEQNAQPEMFEKLSKYVRFLDIVELVSNAKSFTSTKSLENLFARTMNIFSAGENWYSLINNITQVVQHHVKQSGSSGKTLEFLGKIKDWIKADQPVPTDVFIKYMNDCYPNGIFLQGQYDISVVKLKKLLNHLEIKKVGELPKKPAAKVVRKETAWPVIHRGIRPAVFHRGQRPPVFEMDIRLSLPVSIFRPLFRSNFG